MQVGSRTPDGKLGRSGRMAVVAARVCRWRVAGAALLAALILTAALSSGAGAAGNARGPRSGSTTQADRAKSLAAEVRHASNRKQRSKALRDVMRAVHIGVYKPNGARILRGDESGRKDFYLYSFDLRVIGDALDRGSQTSVSNLAQGLSSLSTSGKSVDGPTLGKILVDGVHSAVQNPSARLSLVPLLVRDLGLHHRHAYDLARGIPIDQPSLDALQRFLITADVSLTILRQIHHQAAPQSSGAQASGSPCESDFSGKAGDWPLFGKWGPSLKRKLSIEVALETAGVVIDGLQGSVLAFSVDVHGLGKYRVHADMGYPGHAAGNFEVGLRVKMLDDLGSTLVKCGRLAGAEFPPKGPIRGVPVAWSSPEDDVYGSELANWGEVTCPKVGCQRTDSNGEAWSKFQAGSYSDCYGGCIGQLALGHYDANPHYLSKFHNVLGVVAENLFPKDYTPHWEVRFQPCAPRVNGMKC